MRARPNEPGPTTSAAVRRHATLVWLSVFLALFAASQVPLHAVRYPDIVDFPNHVARLHVLAELAGSPLLQRYYVGEPGIAPNLAMDLLAPPIAAMLGVETAVRIFASGASLLAASGVAALTYVLHGRLTMFALGGVLFAQSAFHHLGLFNFVLGVGVALWLLAAWIRLRRRRLPMAGLLPAFGGAVALAWLCHLTSRERIAGFSR